MCDARKTAVEAIRVGGGVAPTEHPSASQPVAPEKDEKAAGSGSGGGFTWKPDNDGSGGSGNGGESRSFAESELWVPPLWPALPTTSHQFQDKYVDCLV